MRPSFLLPVALLALAGTAHTQAPTPAPAVFGGALTVVSVPVFVTDKAGKAIPGLTAADFQVEDDGRAVKLVAFHEVDTTRPLARQEFRSEGAALAARRQFLLLFDLSFTSVSGLVRSREAAEQFLGTGLGPSDLASVATFSVRSGVKLLIGFTSDRGQLQQAVRTLGLGDLDRRADPLGLTFDPRTSNDPEMANPKDAVFQEWLREMQLLYRRSEAADYRSRVAGLLKSMAQLGQMLDSVHGRKQIIYLSAGFEQAAVTTRDEAMRQGQAVTEGKIWEVESDSRFGDSGLRDEMDRMLRALSSADVVVHSVDVTGLANKADASLVREEGPIGGGRESLFQIADGTGGRFYKDINDLGPVFGAILGASRTYYVLGFVPEDVKGAGKYHKLKVKVSGKDREVSSRRGWTEADPTAARAQMAANLLAGEAIVKGTTGGEIALGVVAVPYRNAQGKASVPVALEVDGPSLIERSVTGALTLQIYGYALDEQGRILDMVNLTSTLDLSKLGARLEQKGLQLHTAFALPPGQYSLRFLVRDAETGRRGTTALDITVPALEPDRLALAPPLFMDDLAAWIVLQSPSRRVATLDLPFRIQTDPFVPRTRPTLVNGRTDSVCVLLFDGGARYAQGAQFEIKAQLLDTAGTPVRIGKLQVAKVVAESDGFRRFVLNVTPADVAPGAYAFKIKVKDPVTGNLLESTQTVRVE
jgi:VWFA-related protein